MSTPSLSSLSSSSSSLSERLRANLHEAGFDIFHGPFAPSLYNDVLESEGLIASGTLSKLPEECTPTTAANDGGDGGGDGDDDDDSDNDNDDDDDDDDDPSNKNKNNNKEPLKTEAFLIGNTKHLWPIFLEWLERKEHDNNNNNNNNGLTIATKDPLDSYERTVIRAVVRDSLGANNNNNNNNARQRQRQRQRQSVYNVDVDTDVYCSSEWEDPTRMVSMARVASCTGYSYLDPHTHLSVHPVYGTWHSYRAVLLLPAALAEEENDDSTAAAELKLAAPPPPPPPRLLPNPVTPAETLAARRAFDRALAVSTTQTTNTNEKKKNNNNNHNENDDDNRLLCEELGSGVYKDGDEGRKQTVAAAWIALRDSVSIGRENHRFGDHQLSYHYTKDPSCLLAGIEALRSGGEREKNRSAAANANANAKTETTEESTAT
eukprot:jgi/Psemu1/37264/gm1.37264_g